MKQIYNKRNRIKTRAGLRVYNSRNGVVGSSNIYFSPFEGLIIRCRPFECFVDKHLADFAHGISKTTIYLPELKLIIK